MKRPWSARLRRNAARFGLGRNKVSWSNTMRTQCKPSIPAQADERNVVFADEKSIYIMVLSLRTN
jgi:hypothetical protein